MGAEQRGETPPESELTRARGAKVRGVSFWHAALQSQTIELNTHDDLDLEAGRSRWAVSSIPGGAGGQAIESSSPAVRGFLQRVVAEKVRIARRGMTRSPIPKPAPRPSPSLPAHAPVPCPLCRPAADAQHPGEAWPDCELCNGDGVVTAHQAAVWRQEHL